MERIDLAKSCFEFCCLMGELAHWATSVRRLRLATVFGSVFGVRMALGDGVRRKCVSVEPAERALLRDAFVELNGREFAGSRDDEAPGGVTWFNQDEIHQATPVHDRPEFLPWYRVLVNRFEAPIRQLNPQLSRHYWDWTRDPRAIPAPCVQHVPVGAHRACEDRFSKREDRPGSGRLRRDSSGNCLRRSFDASSANVE
jgi:hypothetical protein